MTTTRAGRLLPSRSFARLLAASGISAAGDGILVVALPLIARTVTTSPRSIAGIFAISRLPVLLLSFGGAAVADRSDARKTMVVADLVRAAVLIALAAAAISGSVTIAAVYVTAFVLGLFEVPFTAASQRMISTTLPDALLPRGNARLASVQVSGEQFVGPAIGGQLTSIGPSVPLLGDAASFLLSAAFLRGLPPAPPTASVAGRPSIRDDIRAGVRWFAAHRVLRTTTFAVALLGFAQAMVNSLLVPLAADTLGLSSRGVGLFVASIAVGNVLGSFVAPRLLAAVGYGPCILSMLVGAGLGYGAIGYTSNTVVVAACMIVEGVAIMVGQVAFNVLRQRLIPREMIGRVFTTTRVIIRGAAPFGALLGGELAQRQGPPGAILVAGVLALLFSLALGPSLLVALRSIRAKGVA